MGNKLVQMLKFIVWNQHETGLDSTRPYTILVLQNVCNSVLVEPKKAIRKLPRVQHLYAKLAGRLRSEEDEVNILHFSASNHKVSFQAHIIWIFVVRLNLHVLHPTSLFS